MKKYSLIILSLLIILTGCASKSSFSLTFDKFTFNFYDNNKEYINQALDTSTSGIKVLKEMKQNTGTGSTGFISSLVIIKTPIQSGIDMKSLVSSNADNLKSKLLKFVPIDTSKKKLKCNGLQYSGYITSFSYQLDTQKIYGGQYFFTDNDVVYVISFNTTDKKESKQFARSIGTMGCVE